MPKLQKQKAWKRKNKVYSKWVINIPEEEIKKANLKEGEELTVIAHGDKTLTLAVENEEDKK